MLNGSSFDPVCPPSEGVSEEIEEGSIFQDLSLLELFHLQLVSLDQLPTVPLSDAQKLFPVPLDSFEQTFDPKLLLLLQFLNLVLDVLEYLHLELLPLLLLQRESLLPQLVGLVVLLDLEVALLLGLDLAVLLAEVEVSVLVRFYVAFLLKLLFLTNLQLLDLEKCILLLLREPCLPLSHELVEGKLLQTLEVENFMVVLLLHFLNLSQELNLTELLHLASSVLGSQVLASGLLLFLVLRKDPNELHSLWIWE